MAKTKSVGGKDLAASDFAYVGDPEDTSTWSLPVHDASHVQNALARFNQTDLPADKKTAVARKLCNKAKSMGIDAGSFEKQYCGTQHADFGDGWVEIFRAGDYGDKGKFDESDLDRVIGAYDPAVHEAPACLGHPEHDAPAYGWVDRLKRSGATLLAKFREVDPGFESLVKDGKFKKRSAAFYVGSDGRLAGLRHVGFLGAMPPEVKGLANLKFDDGGRAFKEVDFGEEPVAVETEKNLGERLVALLREHIPGLGGSKAFGEDELKRMASEAVAAATKPLQDKITELETSQKKQTTEFAERELKLVGNESKQRADAAIARVKAKGAWTPAFDKMGVPVLFAELAKETATIEFGEGAEKKTVTKLDLLVTFMEGLGQIVPAGRVFGGATASGAAPANPKDDPLTAAARVRQKEGRITFGEALRQVAEEHPELTMTGAGVAGQV